MEDLFWSQGQSGQFLAGADLSPMSKKDMDNNNSGVDILAEFDRENENADRILKSRLLELPVEMETPMETTPPSPPEPPAPAEPVPSVPWPAMTMDEGPDQKPSIVGLDNGDLCLATTASTWQPAPSGVTSVAWTLEYQTVQMTQRPHVILHHPVQLPQSENFFASALSAPMQHHEQHHQHHQQPADAGADVEPPGIEQSPRRPTVMSPGSDLTEPDPGPPFSVSAMSLTADAAAAAATPMSELSGDSVSVSSASLDGQVESIQKIIDLTRESSGGGHRRKKPKAIEFVVAALLDPGCSGIVAFCDKRGGDFKVLDTPAMGRLWQRFKGNGSAKFDTLARAMRLDREKSQKQHRGPGRSHFDYLDGGKGSRKRVYKLSDAGREVLDGAVAAIERSLTGRPGVPD